MVRRFARLHRLEGQSGASSLARLSSHARYSRDYASFLNNHYFSQFGKPKTGAHGEAAKRFFSAAKLGSYVPHENVPGAGGHEANFAIAIKNANLMRKEIGVRYPSRRPIGVRAKKRISKRS